MNYLRYISPSRSSVLKILSTLFFLINICLMQETGNYAFPDEGSVFSIHLFSFSGVEEAKSKVKEFNDLGYNAFYRQETADGKADLYDVYIERFKSRPEAEKEASILKELDLISNYEIREIIGKSKIGEKNEKQEPKAVKQDVKGYYLKVSSLKEKENAEVIVKKLQDAGYHAFYDRETVKDKGDWYRVYIDEYKSKGDAEKDAKKLMQSGMISSYEIKRTTEEILTAEITQKNIKKIYSLHVASYKEESHAGNDVLRLSASGLKAFSVKTELSGEQWFRVFAGEFSDEKEARKAGAELLEKGIITYYKPMIIDKAIE